ncbi:hypothetical protein [Pseudomonas phage LKA1]|uniref:Uncharacterized protein n=1 Tax=Pseudomonas phage LKA1 TaxID=386793 RepID=Q0E5Z5_9CAUD|nr:hypothetical protein AV952_gp19 [Pseudomonas phage LKA1]CAK24987.1 hypothetical protein [Pseudomonas phage LKA1]
MSGQVKLNHSADDVAQMRRDWAESSHFDAPADLPGLLDDYDAMHAEAEALRAENAKWQRSHQDIHEPALREAHAYIQELRTELEEAQGLLRDMRHAARINPSCQQGMVNPCRCGYCVDLRIDAFLTSTQAPEARDHIERHLTMAEQGERQEAVAWALANSADEIGGFAPIYYTKEGAISWQMAGTFSRSTPPRSQARTCGRWWRRWKEYSSISQWAILTANASASKKPRKPYPPTARRNRNGPARERVAAQGAGAGHRANLPHVPQRGEPCEPRDRQRHRPLVGVLSPLSRGRAGAEDTCARGC